MHCTGQVNDAWSLMCGLCISLHDVASRDTGSLHYNAFRNEKRMSHTGIHVAPNTTYSVNGMQATVQPQTHREKLINFEAFAIRNSIF